MKNNFEEVALASSISLDVPFLKIVGGGGTGKTLSLAKRVEYLFSAGVAASDILVLCSTRSAVDAFTSLLESCNLEPEQIPQVTTLALYAVSILDTPEAREATGRVPRILVDFEERILMEDMKVTGLKPKRLREMLKFFYKEFSELGDEKEGFIQDTEEQDILDTLHENLRFRNSMLNQELSNIAYKYVRDYEEQAAQFKKPFVLVDDFQNLSMVSQMLAELLCTRQLVLTGALNEQISTLEPYPYPQGFRAFEITHKGAEVTKLNCGLRMPDRIAAMANSMVIEGGLEKAELVALGNEKPSEVRFAKWTHPNDEFLGIVRYIKHRLADPTHPIHAKDIFISVPNAVWGKAFKKVLEANHINADLVLSHHTLRGDIRKSEKCMDIQAYTRLNLAADPLDAAAWRTWCAVGDFLANSNHWFRLEKYAQSANIGVLEALERASLLTDCELFTGANVLVERYLEGKKFIESCKGKQGFALLNQCAPVRGEEPPAGFMDLVSPVSGHESAQEFLVRANARQEARFTNVDAVRIGLMEMTCGMSFDTVIFTGAVEGYYPALITIGAEYDDERKEEVRKQERREWYSAMAKAHYAFIASTVQKDESNTAAALGMYAHRIRMENGTSMAILAPTPYLEEMGEEAPGYEAVI